MKMIPDSKNILLISGSGRNVGKTRFICGVIAANSTHQPLAIKITPHFHKPTPGLETIAVTENYRVYFETDMYSGKDSALFLEAGAGMVIYIQTTDQYLEEAFHLAVSKNRPGVPVITESAALRKYVVPGLYLFIQKDSDPMKPFAAEMQKLANATIISDGSVFSTEPNSIVFNQTWKINDKY
jgi:hypothetical protein